MKPNQLKIMRGLLENPKGSDRAVAQKVGVSQPTITRARQNLQKQGIIESYQIVPDLAKLGFELIAFSVMQPSEEIEETENIVYAVQTRHGLFTISMHENYTDYYGFVIEHNVKTTFLATTAIAPVIPLDFSKLVF